MKPRLIRNKTMVAIATENDLYLLTENEGSLVTAAKLADTAFLKKGSSLHFCFLENAIAPK